MVVEEDVEIVGMSEREIRRLRRAGEFAPERAAPVRVVRRQNGSALVVKKRRRNRMPSRTISTSEEDDDFYPAAWSAGRVKAAAKKDGEEGPKNRRNERDGTEEPVDLFGAKNSTENDGGDTGVENDEVAIEVEADSEAEVEAEVDSEAEVESEAEVNSDAETGAVAEDVMVAEPVSREVHDWTEASVERVLEDLKEKEAAERKTARENLKRQRLAEAMAAAEREEEDAEKEEGKAESEKGGDGAGLGKVGGEGTGEGGEVEGEEEGEEDEEGGIVAPQVTVDSEGNIIINEESLMLTTGGDVDAVAGATIEVDPNAYINSATYMKKEPSRRWSTRETALFYSALRQFGTDFGMMENVIPNRSRKQIKLKYNREEKMHPYRVGSALSRRIPVSTDVMTAVEERIESTAREKQRLKEEQAAKEAQEAVKIDEVTESEKVEGGLTPFSVTETQLVDQLDVDATQLTMSQFTPSSDALTAVSPPS